MYAVKGSWVGQTFALATASDSSGKKSRVRRRHSKAERKSMAETFIKRYQSSNDGNFPSLNLTHKEVGGSFYNIREIVREIIQENRVLGPARFSPKWEHEDGGKCFDVNEMNTDMDGSEISGLSDGTDKLQEEAPLVSRRLETDEEFAPNGAGKAQVRLPTEEISVETFPLRLENKGTDDLGTLSTDSVISTDHLATKGTNGSQLSVSGICPDIESNNVPVNGVLQHTECSPINEASDFTELSEIKEDPLVHHDPMDQKSLQSSVTLETSEQLDKQSKNASKGTACLEEKSKRNDKERPFLPLSGNNSRRDDKTVAASSPPVDRINLQSWERAASKRQPNPLMAIFKAFADALIKFWS